MMPRDHGNIHTTRIMAHGIPADEIVSWLQLPILVSLLSGGTVQPKNSYSCILKVTSQLSESQKRISIITNIITGLTTTSVHLISFAFEGSYTASGQIYDSDMNNLYSLFTNIKNKYIS